MDRIYHQRFTLAAKCCITVVTLLAVYLFWNKSTANVIIGLVLILILVYMIEHVIHTSYTFTDSGLLIIDGGRFSKQVSIPVNEIVRITKRSSKFKFSHYVLIEYGADKMVSVLPENEEIFIEELKKRQNKVDKSL